jgi:hypothetical protein
MSPEYVRPYVKAQKNDDRDVEAATRPTMRFVAVRHRAALRNQADVEELLAAQAQRHREELAQARGSRREGPAG